MLGEHVFSSLTSSILLRFNNSSMWRVYVGLTEQQIHAAQSLAVRNIVYHARYRTKGLDYDVALMRLDQPLTFNGMMICRSRASQKTRVSSQIHILMESDHQ